MQTCLDYASLKFTWTKLTLVRKVKLEELTWFSLLDWGRTRSFVWKVFSEGDSASLVASLCQHFSALSPRTSLYANFQAANLLVIKLHFNSTAEFFIAHWRVLMRRNFTYTIYHFCCFSQWVLFWGLLLKRNFTNVVSKNKLQWSTWLWAMVLLTTGSSKACWKEDNQGNT